MAEFYEWAEFLDLSRAFVENIALFIVISFILGRLSDEVRPGKDWRWHLGATLIFSTGAITSMAIPYEPSPGILLDQRNVILLFAGPFGGPWAAIGSGVATALARLYVGGAGAYAGFGAALSTALLSLVFIRHLGRLERKRSAILGGMLLCVCNLPWVLLFPNPALGLELTINFALPFFLFYLIGPAALTTIMMVHRRRLIAERELAASQQILKDVLDTATDWFWETDKNYRFTYISQSFSQVFSRDPSYYIGKKRSELATADNLDDVLAYEAMLARHKPFVGFRYKLNAADGSDRHVSISGKPIFDEDDQFTGFRGSGREVTVEVNAEQKLKDALQSAEEANRAKSAFLSQMSHELRTPLNAIIGFADMIRMQIRGPVANEAYREDAQHISDSGSHLLSLINQLLDLSKIEAGKLELELNDCAPAEIVDWVGDMMAPRLQKAGLNWEVSDHMTLKTARLDEGAIRQVLLNLVGNAVKFTPPGGTVSVRLTTTSDGALRLQVQDTGTGIAEAEVSGLFKPFERASNASQLAAEGTGLGLTICKALVEAHGGSIVLESQPDYGTTVTITLPVARSKGLTGIAAA